MTYYKVLNADRSCCDGGNIVWEPEGVPMPPIVGYLMPYLYGYHVCTADQLINWVGPAIWEVEVDTAGMQTVPAITVVRGATLVRRTAWDMRSMALWALDCAEHVQHFVAWPETAALNAVTRRNIAGEATVEEINAARYACQARNPPNPGYADHYANYAAVSACDAACFRDAAYEADIASFGGYTSYLVYTAHKASTEARSAVFAARYSAVYDRIGACESSNYEACEAEETEKTWQANQLLTYL